MALRDIFAAFRVTVDQRELVQAQLNIEGLISQFNVLKRVASFALAAIGIGKITEAADEYITLENKLKAVTTSTADFLSAQKGVERIADEVAQPVADIADSFLRYSLATESLGASQEEVLDFTKRVTQAMILSGATSAEAHRAAVQLAQGFGKNFKAAAQDLKSVKEQAPVLARIIEKAAGGVPGSLLVMAKAGQITSKLVFDAVRADGGQLDRDFAKRQKTFENMSNLLGNQWLQLIKRLKPIFVPIIAALESIVHWIQEWVKDGSAMNSVVAGAITTISFLTYAFGGLAISVAATLAPFAALFLVLDDLAAFARGDISITGDFLEKHFGRERTEKLKQRLNELTETVKSFLKAFLEGDDGEQAKWAEKFASAWKKAMSLAAQAVAEVFALALRSALGEKVSDALGIRKPGQSDYEIAMGNRPGATAEERAKARQLEGTNPDPMDPKFYDSRNRPDPLWDGYVPRATIPEMAPAPWAPVSGSTYQSPYRQDGAPQITNNITVQGNADAPVAREIANRTGNAVAEILGRDRSAVGAGFGLSP